MHDQSARQNPRPAQPEDGFVVEFETHVLQKALPAFEEACRFARDRGLDCQVELLEDSAGQPQLCLLARLGESQPHSHYRIVADPASQGLTHELYLACDDQHQRLSAHLASINSTVLDTQLAEFFRRAFGMRLEYVEERHDVGF
ncbi:MAG: hypothetical protein GAK43_00759 [Stenotrophomonas maltophilia]|nr:MAG: hypothetical protein GAK43_00759 [Stenotrophomonas maltophilia]